MAQEGAPLKKIRTTVLKKDGKIGSLRAIDAIIGHTRKDPSWEGGNSSAGGRPQEMTPAELRRLQKFIHDEVGLAKVTMPYMKKRLPFLRRLSTECLRQSLRRLGYGWRIAK